MFKIKKNQTVRFLFFLLVSAFFIFPAINRPAFSDTVEKAPTVLVVYHSQYEPDYKGILDLPEEAIMISNAIGHFTTKVSQVALNQYYSGLLANYDYVVYIGYPIGEKIPDIFLNDIVQTPKTTVVWLRGNIEQLTQKHSDYFAFRTLPLRGGFTSLIYNNLTYARPDTEMVVPIEVTDWDQTETKGILQSDRGFTPFVIHAKNLWYFADNVMYGVSNLAFCDVLNDVFDRSGELNYRFFIRIEDIHPLREPKKLKNICDVFAGRKLPFMMAVIPKYTKPNTNKEVYLHDKPHLVKVLRYCASKGGSIIMHGYTHQWKNESGEGYEFWDVPNDRPISEYTEDTIREKMKNGIDELTGLGLYPVAWETPHYSASEESYHVISQYFSTAVEQRQVSNRTYHTTQALPYIVHDVYDQTLVPENMGYINLEIGETVEKKLETAEKYKIVRNALVGGFYHPYFKAKYLEDWVDGLLKLGFRPFDLRNIPGVIAGENIAIFTGIGADPFPLLEPARKLMTTTFVEDPRLLNIKMNGRLLHTYLLNYKNQQINNEWYHEKLEGNVLVKIPQKLERLFVIERAAEQPSWILNAAKKVKSLLIGDTFSAIGTFQRWAIWILLLSTVVFLGFAAKILITRTSYHESHFRDDDTK